MSSSSHNVSRSFQAAKEFHPHYNYFRLQLHLNFKRDGDHSAKITNYLEGKVKSFPSFKRRDGAQSSELLVFFSLGEERPIHLVVRGGGKNDELAGV